jgi:copper resistance protein B
MLVGINQLDEDTSIHWHGILLPAHLDGVPGWRDVVAGVRQGFRPGPSQTWAAIRIQGLAPQWFEVEATVYIGESAATLVRFEAEYEVLLTNRLMLQPLVEVNLFG